MNNFNTITIFLYTDYDGKSSRTLLLESASAYSGVAAGEFRLVHEGKPYFESHPEIHFSISHSGSIWIAAFARNEVGIDVQGASSYNIMKEKIARRYFNAREYEFFLNGADFYSIWARKEAVCKLFGWGIDRRFSLYDVTGDVLSMTIPDGFEDECGMVYIKNISLVSLSEPYCCACAYKSDFCYKVHKIY